MKFLVNNVLFTSMFIVLFCCSICSCKNNKSLPSQITAAPESCSTNEEQAFHYYEKYGRNNSQIKVNYGDTTGNEREAVIKAAFKALSNVPEEYLEYTFKTYNIPVNLITQKTRNEKYDGLTYMNNKGQLSPKEISYSTIQVLVHEIGHVVHGIPEKKYSNFPYDLTDLANDIEDTQKSAYLKHYTNSDQEPKDAETFAELFDTWYCSKAARNLLDSQINEAYQFAKKYLLPPIGESKEQQVQSDSPFIEMEQDIKTYQEINNILKNITPNLSSTNCTSGKQGSVYTIKDNTSNRIWTGITTSSKPYWEAKKYCETLKADDLSFRLPTFEEVALFYNKGCLKTGEPLWTETIPYIDDNALYVFQPNNLSSFKISSKTDNLSFVCIAY